MFAVLLSYLFQFAETPGCSRSEIRLTAFNALKGSIEQISDTQKQVIVPRNPSSGNGAAPDARKPLVPMCCKYLPESAGSKCCPCSQDIRLLTRVEPGGIFSDTKRIHFLRILII